MKTRVAFTLRVFLTALVFGALSANIAMASDACAPVAVAPVKESGWKFQVAPYGWLTSISGDTTIKGLPSHVSVPFSDVLKDLDFGGMFNVEARKDPWVFFLNIIYAKLSPSGTAFNENLGPVGFNSSFKQLLIEGGAGYRLGEWRYGAEDAGSIAFEGVGGFRYWNLGLDLSLSSPFTNSYLANSGSENWVDPLLGGSCLWNISKKVSFILRGDLGGFGVSSHFTWSVSGVFDYRFTDSFSTGLGYRALGVDYETGSGFNKLKYDVILYGPILGARFMF